MPSATWIRVYLSGPMTGLEDLNRPAFAAAAARLRSVPGVEVVSPPEIAGDASPSWAACMKLVLPHMMTCHVVAMLPGWERSKGAKTERWLALVLGMPVWETGGLA
jgi:hypothetical protein